MTDARVTYTDGITFMETVTIRGIEQLPAGERAVLDALADGDAPLTVSEVGRALGVDAANHRLNGASRARGTVAILDT